MISSQALGQTLLKMVVHRQERTLACALEAQGEPAHTEHHRAEWARRIAAELRKQGTARSKELAQAKGETIPPERDHPLHDTLTVPDLASAEASFERTRLLLSSGPNVAAVGIDAADSIQARNSLEKMMAHQLAATHAVIMEQVGQVHSREEGQASAKNGSQPSLAASMRINMDF